MHTLVTWFLCDLDLVYSPCTHTVEHEYSPAKSRRQGLQKCFYETQKHAHVAPQKLINLSLYMYYTVGWILIT